MPIDRYAMAREQGDTVSPNIWQGFTDSIPLDIIVAFDYVPFLQHERPKERNEYGPFPGVWEESTRHVIAIYEQSLTQALRTLPESPVVQQGSYVPPSRYAQGGPIVFPMELIHVVLEDPWLLAVGANVVSNLISDAIKAAFGNLRDWFKERGVPELEWEFPSLSPFIVRSVAESHAREFFPRHSPGEAEIIPSDSLNADYPSTGMQFLVLIPYEKGVIIYFVDDRLRLSAIMRTYPGGFVPLRSAGWPMSRL